MDLGVIYFVFICILSKKNPLNETLSKFNHPVCVEETGILRQCMTLTKMIIFVPDHCHRNENIK